MTCNLDIKVDREDRKYIAGKDKQVRGEIVFNCDKEIGHAGVQLVMEGSVTTKIEGKVLTKNLKPISLIYQSKEIAKAGKLAAGETKIPFQFDLQPLPGQELYETFHGWAINIKYFLKCTCNRTGLLARKVYKEFEFMLIANTKEETPAPKEVPITITQNSHSKKKKNATVAAADVGPISVKGKLTTATCNIGKPLGGEIVVEECDAVIQSICLQLIRIETLASEGGYVKEVSEVQNTEIATGDVCRQLAVPIYLLFPRLYTCPTLHTSAFRIEFAVNVLVKLKDTLVLREQFPLMLVRN